MSKHSMRIGSDSRFSALAQLLERLDAAQAAGLRGRVVGLERQRRVLRGQVREPPLLAAHRAPDLDARAASLGEELLGRGEVAGLRRHDDLRRDRRRRAVVLDEERLEHVRVLLPRDVLEVERVAVDHLAAAQREDLHRAAVARERDADHVDVADVAAVCGLPLREVLDREEPVAVARRLLELLLLGGGAHPLLHVAQDRRRVAGEKLRHAADHLGVALLRDVVDTRRQAAVDVVVEARDARVPARLRPSQGRKRKTRFRTSSVSRTFFAFAYGPK